MSCSDAPVHTAWTAPSSIALTGNSKRMLSKSLRAAAVPSKWKLLMGSSLLPLPAEEPAAVHFNRSSFTAPVRCVNDFLNSKFSFSCCSMSSLNDFVMSSRIGFAMESFKSFSSSAFVAA